METTILNSANQPADLSKLTQEQLNLLLRQAEYAEAEREALKGKTHEEMITYYLDYKAKQSPELAAKYPNNPKGKSMKDCYEYITNKVRKMANGRNSAMLQHNEVFAMAEQYFMDDTIEKVEHKAPVTRTTTPTNSIKTMSAEEREKKAKEWEEDRQKRQKAWIENNKKNYDKWQQEHDKKVNNWKMDLFADHNTEPDFVKETNPYDPSNSSILKETNPYIITEDNNKKDSPAEQTAENQQSEETIEEPEEELEQEEYEDEPDIY